MNILEANHPYYNQLTFAVDQAIKAGAILLNTPSGALQTEIKEDNTPVTIADRMINHNFIIDAGEEQPGIGVVGEEESTADYGMGKRWIIDPIDGTAAKLVGLNSAVCSIAYVEDGETMVAVVREPMSDSLFVTVRGMGSYLNGKRLQVSKATFETGIIALAPDYVKNEKIDEPWVRKLLAFNKELAIFPGAVYRSCHIATGEIAGFPHPLVKPYDIAAANLIVTEAGGMATRVDGSKLDFSTDFRGAILSNGAVHQDLITLFL